jgi:Flp pilus assembly protein TadG
MFKLRTPAARGRRPGAVAAIVALSLVALIGLLALSIDGGMLYLDLRAARATADAAAMAAACDLFKNYPANAGKDPDGTAAQAALDAARANGAFTESGGPVIVNSNSASALLNTGNGAMTAPEFDVTGGVQLGNGSTFQTAPVANQIFTGTHPTPDPLAYLPPPSMPPDGTITTTSLAGGGTQYVLTPGRYTNLPTFNTGDAVILKQASADGAGGVYYIDGGGFNSNGANITLDPNTTGGVMIYNAPASSASSEQVQITGNPTTGTVNLSPLTSGPYAGLVLWQKRSSSLDVRVEGNGSFTINGTLYAAGARLNIVGSAQTSGGTATGSYVDGNGIAVQGGSKIGSQYISKNLSLSGNGNISIKSSGADVARTRIITLVE